MDYASKSAQQLRDLARERKIASNGTVGSTSWLVNAKREALESALTANDAGVPLPMESSNDANDAARMLADAIAALTSRSGGDVDEATVRRIARDEALKVASPVTHVLRESAGTTVEVGRTHNIFARVLDVTSAGLVAYLVGPPGCGKSHLCGQLATALSLSFEADSFNEQTPDYRVAGYMNAAGVFVETPFYRTVSDGRLYLGDELDKANANMTGTLNLALSNGHASFANGLMPRHPNARFIFAGNTVGLGATPQYPDRNVLPADLRDRFTFIEMPYDEKLERDLALARNADAGAWVDFVQSIRANVQKAGLPLVVSPRASMNGATLLAMKWSRADVENAVIWRGAPDSIVTRARGGK